jgi:4-hydroxy-2-oxoglutarate aldolase
MELSGIYPALTTPYAADGSVSLADFKNNIQRYNNTDLVGYVVLGSTGEAVLLSKAEMDGILVTAKEAAAPGKRLIAGTGAESTVETIERCKRAAELGYQVALVKTPHYYKPAYKPDVLVAHYRSVADASPIPVLLYSVPQFTGVTLETPEIVALAEHSNIIGIKDSSANVQRLSEVVAAAPAGFQVLYPSLAIGARGAILALASALPEKCVALYDLCRREQFAAARELQSVLAQASKLIVSEGGIAAVKYAMDLRGYRGGVPRLPLPPLSDSKKNRISELLQQLEPAVTRA